MNRCTTSRRHEARGPAWSQLFVQLGVLASCNALVAACAPAARYEEPSDLRAYEILITRHDSLGRELAQGLKRRGFTVRDRVRGGGRPTAYLFAFTFRETDPPGGGVTWLDVRLADTRSGAIVAAASVPLDSLGGPLAERAVVIVDSLAASATLRQSLSPP
ncbi:MAG TPA: hypothetical protein VM716_01560 [Gemmatimonadales bacterium]|nr:hypothetical protein [Gemmatimonadales bacterium]